MALNLRFARCFARGRVVSSLPQHFVLARCSAGLQRNSLAHQSRRTIFHLPPLAFGAKLLAGFAAKKFAVLAVVRKYGVKKAFGLMRNMNDTLLKSGEQGNTAHKTIAEGIDALEKGVAELSEHEQLARIWSWVESIDKQNPTFVNSLIKHYVESTDAYKGVRTLMSFREESATGVGGAASRKAGEAPDTAGVVTDPKLIEEIYNAVPHLRGNYHVILLPIDRAGFDNRSEHRDETAAVVPLERV